MKKKYFGNIFLLTIFSLTVPENIEGCKYKKKYSKKHCTQQQAKHSYLHSKEIKKCSIYKIYETKTCQDSVNKYVCFNLQFLLTRVLKGLYREQKIIERDMLHVVTIDVLLGRHSDIGFRN